MPTGGMGSDTPGKYGSEIVVTADDPGSQGDLPTVGGPGTGIGDPGLGGGDGKPGGAGGLPPWLAKILGTGGAGGVMGPVGMGMDAFQMAGAPQQQAMEEAKAGSMAGYQNQQQAAWQSPAYMDWARQLWGG